VTAASSEEPDEVLMARYAREGDKAAFEQLFRRWAPRLSSLLSRTAGPSDQVEDLLQKTFLHVHRARADYQPSRPFRPWICTIALNVRRENSRSRSRRKEAALDPEHIPEPGVPPEVRTPDERAVQQALMKLGDAHREVIVLHWYEGFSFPEIAELLGATTTAVKVRAHRAYEALRGLLADLA
jgi:RNA polymerase sigma-70 factor (ECF subfamily)